MSKASFKNKFNHLAPSWQADLDVLIEKNNAHSPDYVSCFSIEERSKMPVRWDAKWLNLFLHDA